MWIWAYLENFLSWWSLFLVFLSYVTATYISNWIKTRGKNVPPGPWGVPVLGYLPFLTRTPHVKLTRLAKKYGDVFGINLIGDTCVVLNSYDAIKEAFITRGSEITALPEKFSFIQWICDGKSIFAAESDEWNEHRRFLIQTLRDLGVGKHSLVERVQDIGQDLLDEFRSTCGTPFDPISVIYNCNVNVMCSLLFNKHFQHDDPEFIIIKNGTRGISTALEGVEILLAKGNLFYLSSGYRALRSTKSILYKLIRKLIREHKENLDESNPMDYMDHCLLEMKKHQVTKEAAGQYHTEEYIIGNCVVTFLAGVETTTSSIYWFLNFMMVYPEVQKKVQNELDEVVGRQRLPHWLDRTSLPYTEAVLREMQRIASVVPLGLIKCNYEHMKFRGFDIDKRSHFFSNLWAANRDPKYWPNPEKFDPNRFLDANGKCAAKDHSVPFSIGKRACAGESLSRMQLFTFFTVILHQFCISPPEGVTPTLDCRSTVARTPFPYKLRALPRA